MPTAARTAKKGLLGGLAFGLVQDALGVARGRRIGYVDVLFGRGKMENEEDGEAEAARFPT